MQNQLAVPVITIDGPGGTGKGTICHMLAKKLAWHCLDSGAIYRVFAYAAMSKHVALEAQADLQDLAKNMLLSFEQDADGTHQIYLNHDNVSSVIRSESCAQMASKLAAIPSLRSILLQRQRDFAQMPGLVCDGRDMGTVVFPDAGLKIFLTASTETRAQRRFLQLQRQASDVSLETVIQELKNRDERDSQRQAAPLKPAADAVLIDTSDQSVEEVFNRVYDLAKTRFSSI